MKPISAVIGSWYLTRTILAHQHCMKLHVAKGQGATFCKGRKAPIYYAALNGNTKIISFISKEETRNAVLPGLSGSADLSSGRNEIVSTSKDLGDPLALSKLSATQSRLEKWPSSSDYSIIISTWHIPRSAENRQ